VLVDAKPGAAGQIAAEFVARSPADGYTLFLTTNTTHSANPYLFKKLTYDPVKDFTPIARIGLFPFVLLVDAKLPINSVKDLIAYSKAKPVSYAYTSSAGQVAAAALSNLTGMNAVGVAYKAAPQALLDVVGGQEQFTVIDFATSQPFVKSGRLRALAVTPEARTSLAPELPTLQEAAGLKDFGVVAWQGVFGPAGIPADIVERLSAEILKIITPKEMQERLALMGSEPAPAGPRELDAFVRAQLAVWERQIRIAGMKPE
jgi:tripartite-type tricarboxylate transporter receptor subunit TctC